MLLRRYATSQLNALPRISIITPSYNQGEFLEQTIDSVLSQNYPNLEYIIIDGGSIDQSVEIIRKYDKHLHYWVSESDKGQSDAINKGFGRATGDVINWLNSDDYYHEGALRIVGERFQNPETNVYGGVSVIFNNEGYLYRSRGTDVYPGNLAKTIGLARIDQPETFFRKECLEKVGPLNISFHYLMDRDLWIRYLFNFGLSGIERDNSLLVHFRLHEESKTVSQQESFKNEHINYFYTLCKLCGLTDLAALFEKLWMCEMLPLGYKPDEALAENALPYFFARMAEECYQKNDHLRTKEIFNHVTFDRLDSEYRGLMRKISFRNQYIPLWLIRALRSLG